MSSMCCYNSARKHRFFSEESSQVSGLRRTKKAEVREEGATAFATSPAPITKVVIQRQQ